MAISVKIDATTGAVEITDGTTSILIKLEDLPEGSTAEFRQQTLCIDNVNYTAYFLMTAPVPSA